MKNLFSLEEEVSFFVWRRLVPIFVFIYVPWMILLFNSWTSKNIVEFSIWTSAMIAIAIVGFVFFRYLIEYSVEIINKTLYFNNKRGKHINQLPLCDLDISALIPLEKSDIERSLLKNKRILIFLRAKNKEGSLVVLGSISMKRAVAFQHWVIDHIKESCPEEVYKEAMRHRIEYDPET